jgi:hypothetical protein
MRSSLWAGTRPPTARAAWAPPRDCVHCWLEPGLTSASAPYVRSLRARERRQRTTSERDPRTRYLRSVLDVNDVSGTDSVIRAGSDAEAAARGAREYPGHAPRPVSRSTTYELHQALTRPERSHHRAPSPSSTPRLSPPPFVAPLTVPRLATTSVVSVVHPQRVNPAGRSPTSITCERRQSPTRMGRSRTTCT